jgi:hypothetical protein
MVTAFEARAGLCTLLSLMLVQCSEVLDIPSDPQLVPTGPWRCLHAPTQVPTVTAAQAEVRVQACDFIKNCTVPVTGLVANLCDKRDIGCNSPRLTGITDVDGELRFQVPTAGGGFDGYLQVIKMPFASCTDTSVFGISGSKLLCDLTPTCSPQVLENPGCNTPIFVPAMLFFNPPIISDVIAPPISLQLFPAASLPAVIEAVGSLDIDPSTGSLFIAAVDCDGHSAPGITFQLAERQDRVQALYLNSGVVSSTIGHTDASGTGGLIRVTPGFAQVVGVTGDSMRIGTVGVQVAPGFLTYSALVPSPAP